MTKEVNEKKYIEYKKKKLNNYLYIILSLVVIAIEIMVFFNVINIVWGIISFAFLYIIKKILIK